MQGGSLRGARYSDVSEADIRKSARSYRGDPRFSQFCKQWVAAETFASDPELDKQTSEGLDKSSQAKSWLGLGGLSMFAFTKDSLRVVQQRLKGRWGTSFWVMLFLIIVISRPAFGRLCARLFGLTLRFCMRRLFTLIFSIIDTILEEAILQTETALAPDYAAESPTTAVSQPARDTIPSYIIHIFCMVFGALVSKAISWNIDRSHSPTSQLIVEILRCGKFGRSGKTNQNLLCVWCTHSLSSIAASIDLTSYTTPKGVPSSNTGVPRKSEKSDLAQLQTTAHLNLEHEVTMFDLCGVSLLGSPPPSPPPPGKTNQNLLCVWCTHFAFIYCCIN